MNDWVVTGFVSRVAERVASAGGGFAAQLTDRYSPEDDLIAGVSLRLPVVEPSPEFVEDLRQRLMNAPIVVAAPDRIAFLGGSRLVYGVAAVGSLASAAVVVALILRSRSTQRAAA